MPSVFSVQSLLNIAGRRYAVEPREDLSYAWVSEKADVRVGSKTRRAGDCLMLGRQRGDVILELPREGSGVIQRGDARREGMAHA